MAVQRLGLDLAEAAVVSVRVIFHLRKSLVYRPIPTEWGGLANRLRPARPLGDALAFSETKVRVGTAERLPLSGQWVQAMLQGGEKLFRLWCSAGRMLDFIQLNINELCVASDETLEGFKTLPALEML